MTSPAEQPTTESSSERSEEALLDQLATEVVAALRRGEQPSVEDYARRYPGLDGSVDAYVRSLILLEESSSRHHGLTLAAQSTDPFSRQLGDFRLLRELGRGGMGIVYAAEQVSLNRRVAIKILPRSSLFGEQASARFIREATAAGRLHHSNIVPVFGLGEQQGLRYFVMQCIDGPGLDVVIPEVSRLFAGRPAFPSAAKDAREKVPLHGAVRAAVRLISSLPDDASADQSAKGATEYRTSRPPLEPVAAVRNCKVAADIHVYWKNVAWIGLQAAEALSYAHGHHVLHRDLKPANMLLDECGKLWLTDFGLAKLAEEEALTASGDLVGTLRYSPPEYFHGTYDARSDLYQLGLTLYELIAFRPAVQAANRQQVLDVVLHNRPEPLRKIQSELPQDLETIVMKCLAYEPEGRYASAESLAADLRRFLQDRPIHARRVGMVERTWRWCRRNRAVAALGGFSVTMLLAIAVVSSVAFLRESRLHREADHTTDTALKALDHVYAAFVPGWSTVGEAAESGPLSASPEVAQLLEELVQFYDQLAEQSNREPHTDTLSNAIKALRRVGQIYVRLGNFEKAKETYARAVQRLADLPTASANITSPVMLERARVFNDLGIVYWANRQIEESYESHQVAEELLDRRSGDGLLPNSQEWQFELARTWYLLVRQGRGRFGGVPLRPVITQTAEQFDLQYRTPQRSKVLGRAIKLLEGLVTESRNPEHRHLLAICYREACNPLLTPNGEPVDASISQSIDILEELVAQFPHHIGYRYSLCVSLHWYYIPIDNGQNALPAALARSERALAIADELAHEFPQEWIFQAMQVDINLQMSKFMNGNGRRRRALVRCRNAVEICQSLYEQRPSPAFGYWLGHAHLILGEISVEQELHQAALKPLERSIKLLSASVDSHPEWSHVIYGDLKRAHGRMGTVLDELSRPDDASRAQARAHEYQERHKVALQMDN